MKPKCYHCGLPAVAGEVGIRVLMGVHMEAFPPIAPEPQTLCFEIGVLVQEGRQQPSAGIGGPHCA